MRRVLIPSLALALAASALTLPVSTSAQADPAPARIVSGWMPYWMTSPARPAAVNSAVANADLFTDVSPFWYSATARSGGGINVGPNPNFTNASSNIAWAMQQLRGAGLTVLPAIADGSGKGRMAATLADPAARAAHIADLVALVVNNGYDGLDLDYEVFAFSDGRASWPATQPNWTAFVTELGAALKAQGKLLSVTVPPPCDMNRQCGPDKGYWVYNVTGIAPAVDRIRIMAYDYSYNGIGPIAPIAWVDAIAGYMASAVDPAKVQIGVPTYGRAWTRKSGNKFMLEGTCPSSSSTGAAKTAYRSLTSMTSVTDAEIPNVIAQNGVDPASVTWDANSQESWFYYDKKVNWTDSSGAAQTCTAKRVIWYVGPDAVLARTQLVGKYGLKAAAYWTIGGEDPAQWPLIRAYAQSLAPAESTVSVAAPPAVVTGESFAVTGTVLVNGAPAANAQVMAQFATDPAGTFTDLASGTTDANGAVNIPVTLPGSGVVRLSVAAAEGIPAGVSAATPVAVGSAVTARVAKKKVKAGAQVKVRVIARPAIAGQVVVLQRQVGDRWKRVARASVNDEGRAVIKTRATWGKGRTVLRVITKPKGGAAAGVSELLRIRVR